MAPSRPGSAREKRPICRDFLHFHTTLHRCGQRVSSGCTRRGRKTDPAHGLSAAGGVHIRACGELVRETSSILARAQPARLPSSCSGDLCEADLPAQRAPAEAQARLPCAHVDPRRPPDPQAPPGQGPEAAVRLTRAARGRGIVQRRHRLSRSRDFDAVYRHGRSVSTRFLVLYWFPRDDDGDSRLGIAVPKGTRHGGRPEPRQAPAARDAGGAGSTGCRRAGTTC